ncbi:MAG: V-type ATP synthase subunit I [Clostridia bacterium]|nr:V-type ATP synthase subunit I [Clostridia bacterium]
MATAKMKKLNLAAMAYDRDAILNALQKTGATEVKLKAEDGISAPLVVDCADLRGYYSRAEAALELLTADVLNYEADKKIKEGVVKDGFEISYTEFAAAPELKDKADKVCERVEALHAEKAKNAVALSKVKKTLAAAEILKSVEIPLDEFCDTLNVRARLGTMPLAALDDFKPRAFENPLWEVCELAKNEECALLGIVFHRTAADDGLLQEFGFVQSPFSGDSRTGVKIYEDLLAEEGALVSELNAADEALYGLKPEIRDLKIYCDRLAFELEKAELAEKMRATEVTFLLEAYVPEEAEGVVKDALDGVTGATYYEFCEPADNEMPPTLYKNNKVVSNFETITNMYSPVNSREFDPNAIMAFFYSLFLGFIMADIGYGIMMALCGGLIYYLKRKDDGGLKRMAAVFGIGGIFAILWGVLFGSLFGIEIITPLMPNAKDDSWSVMGINVPAVLIIAMELGIVHLMAGYICKAIQHMRRGHFWDGMFDGFVWAAFSIGVGVAIAGFIEQANMPILSYIGGGIAGVSLLVAMLTAGRHEKVLGKFTKGFGAAYGIINYVSDVLSYARLYGLMLSGAVIAQIIAKYTIGDGTTVGFLLSGNPLLIILGVLIFVIGHVFNIAIGLLGAYIHDARLQYVEFFGKFYEGEGELFAPLGSNHKHIKLQSSADIKRIK